MTDSKDEEIAKLKAQVEALQRAVARSKTYESTLYASADDLTCGEKQLDEIPIHGMNPRHVKEYLQSLQMLDNKPLLNTSSYVNVVQEPEELDVMALGATVNLADASVYPASVSVHDKVVDWIAKLWHCPPPTSGEHYSGAGTVGSTEACLLAGLAHKFRWRAWYAKKNGLSEKEVLGVRPNVVMSSCYQAAWEKLFRYFDVEAKLVRPSIETIAIKAEDIAALCDDKTMCVVGILGNHYSGTYDPIWDLDAAIEKLNAEKGYQIGIHVDAASGGFIAPFQSSEFLFNKDEHGVPFLLNDPDTVRASIVKVVNTISISDDSAKVVPAWDFRLKNVLSISASGHKFGESVCGTGWVVFRHREDLAEHIAISVSYLGGHCDSYTLNFSRPASGVYVQMYKLMRLGKLGYARKVDNQMKMAAYLRHKLRDMKRPDGEPRFIIMDHGDTGCLPVVAARLNNADKAMSYNDIDLQHALAESHWYVSGYQLSFENIAKDGAPHESLFCDAPDDTTMFRVVVKSNMTMTLMKDLTSQIEAVLPVMDKHGFCSVKSSKEKVAAERKGLSHKAC